MKKLIRNFSLGLLVVGSVGMAGSLDLGFPDSDFGSGHGDGGGSGPIIIDPSPGDDHGGGLDVSEVERQVIHCGSSQYGVAECRVPGGGLIVAGRLIRQLSSARCVEGRSYEVLMDSIYVTRGCRGLFEVFVQRLGDVCDDNLGLPDLLELN